MVLLVVVVVVVVVMGGISVGTTETDGTHEEQRYVHSIL